MSSRGRGRGRGGRGRGDADSGSRGGHHGPKPIVKMADGATFLRGLASEVNAGNKARKAGSEAGQAEQQVVSAVIPSQQPPPYDYIDKAEMQQGVSEVNRQDPAPFSLQQSIDTPIHPLPRPVILPQRRPNNKSRGFVHAYAPDLGTYKGITELNFLQFLNDFHKSSKASPVFAVVNVAAMVAGFTPGLIAFAVSNAVAAASQAGAEYHQRYRTNSYLDRANKEFFNPRNLHCLIMTFRPGDSNALLSVDGKTGSSKGVDGGGPLSKFSKKTKSLIGMDETRTEGKFRTADGVTHGEMSLPRGAELVYPDPSVLTALNDGSSSDEDGDKAKKQPSAWKTMGNSLTSYIDKRSQAKFALEHGADSGLAMPNATDSSHFASKYSDPSYVNPVTEHMNNLKLPGSGRGSRGGRGGGGTSERSSREPSPDNRPDSNVSRKSNPSGKHNKKGVGPILGTVLAEDVLYLLIAEIPSQQEVNALYNQAMSESGQ